MSSACLIKYTVKGKDVIEWEKLAGEFNVLKEDGEQASNIIALQAIEKIIGEVNFHEAVEYYISRRPGGELVRHVLWQIRPWSAMKHCYDIYKSDRNIEEKRTAVELLRVIADHRVLVWIYDFLENDDVSIQNWGIRILDQLLWCNLISTKDAIDLLELAKTHENRDVRYIADFIYDYVYKREQSLR